METPIMLNCENGVGNNAFRQRTLLPAHVTNIPPMSCNRTPKVRE
jgi:hypothetical protein